MKIMQAIKRLLGIRPDDAPRPTPRRDVLAAAKKAVAEAEKTCEIHDRDSAPKLVHAGAMLLAVVLASCAAPASDQGQGGSTGATPLVAIYIGTGGGITTTNTSAPTAAPASSASAAQTATNDTKPAIGTDAIKAAVPVSGAVDSAVKVLGGDGTVKVPELPPAKPGE